MKQIRVDSLCTNRNELKLSFTVDRELKQYFKESTLTIDYTVNGKELLLDMVPYSVLVLPFVCNILPIAWLTDTEIVLQELDEDFYKSIDNFKQGYIDMYPNCEFKGRVKVEKVVNNNVADTFRSASFFSAGVDAYCTLARHIHERPDLMTIWGADIPYDNEVGWSALAKAISTEAKKLKLPFIVIHSNFRNIVHESNLTKEFQPILRDGWWHGVQHGIGLIGHAAPSNYLRKVTTQYIAASYWPGAKLTCASWPTIDNYVRFCGCSTVHDAFIPRQDKIITIIGAHYKENMPVKLHVCWKTTTGENCCICEKCCRTIMSLIAEAENPADYGFKLDDQSLKRCISLCRKEFEYSFIEVPFWEQIKERSIENRSEIQKKGLDKYIEWIDGFDFTAWERSSFRKIRRLTKTNICRIIAKSKKYITVK